jgi:hypothetical protein
VKYIENLDDLVFYRGNCDHHFCDWACLDKVLEKSLDTIVDNTLSILREASPSMQKKILKRIFRIYFEVMRRNILKK